MSPQTTCLFYLGMLHYPWLPYFSSFWYRGWLNCIRSHWSWHCTSCARDFWLNLWVIQCADLDINRLPALLRYKCPVLIHLYPIFIHSFSIVCFDASSSCLSIQQWSWGFWCWNWWCAFIQWRQSPIWDPNSANRCTSRWTTKSMRKSFYPGQ